MEFQNAVQNSGKETFHLGWGLVIQTLVKSVFVRKTEKNLLHIKMLLEVQRYLTKYFTFPGISLYFSNSSWSLKK